MPVSKKKSRQVTPVSDDAFGGDINRAINTPEPELSDLEQYYTDDSHRSHKEVISSPNALSHSDKLDPSDFTSLQQYLKSKEMDYSSTDPMSLLSENDLEKSLKEFITIDVLNEDNKFICDTCHAKAPSKIIHCLLL